MADHSRIEWTESTWNAVTGSDSGYALTLSKRLKAMGSVIPGLTVDYEGHPVTGVGRA